jgi:7-keto-8-aminopelargonate synthetase-like enzyme
MFNKLYYEYTQDLKTKNRFRKLPENKLNLDYLDFSSNEYLGLSNHQELLQSSLDTAKKHGIVATGSSLLSGNFEIFNEFETQIAKDK